MLAAIPCTDALMAGQSPDAPAARVDPNVASSPYAGVGSVVVGGSPLSGVVIASQYVLTAAHVVNGQQPSNVQFVLNLGGTPWQSAAESVTIYPTYSFPYDDLAVIKLANMVPDGVPIYKLYSGSITTGLTITLVGYGASGNGDVGVSVGASSTVKRVGGNVVDVLTTTLDSSGKMSRFFVYDFDGPTGNGSLGGPTIGNTVETLVAVGDSGSPSFVKNGTQLQLFGINNFVSSPSGTTVNYEFGTLGGGIVACDPRFASWLQTTTNGTLGITPTADVPLPEWPIELLATAVALTLARETSRRPRTQAG
jgi:secreted trypsin-like serine protease